MYVSPLPKEILRRYRLVQIPCADVKHTSKDMLIYQSSYRLSRTDQSFLEELNGVIAAIKNER